MLGWCGFDEKEGVGGRCLVGVDLMRRKMIKVLKIDLIP